MEKSKKKVPKDKLVFGRTFTDHMFSVEWSKELGGWGDPLIKPYGPLSLNPSASVFHYATEVIEKCLISADFLMVFLVF